VHEHRRERRRSALEVPLRKERNALQLDAIRRPERFDPGREIGAAMGAASRRREDGGDQPRNAALRVQR
jgi:hypothetical protein